MPTITALHTLAGGRVAVDLDGRPWRSISAEAVLAAGLRVDGEVERSALRLLARHLRRERALRVAARAVRHRDLSRAALGERLAGAGVAPALRESTVDTLERAGIVDDHRGASERARFLAGRGFGDVAIRERLDANGFSEEAVADALASLEPEPTRAERLLAGSADRVRAARTLLRKGFDADSVSTHLPADL
jgi:SOS response regulatory protein OraA/RecX